MRCVNSSQPSLVRLHTRYHIIYYFIDNATYADGSEDDDDGSENDDDHDGYPSAWSGGVSM